MVVYGVCLVKIKLFEIYVFQLWVKFNMKLNFWIYLKVTNASIWKCMCDSVWNDVWLCVLRNYWRPSKNFNLYAVKPSKNVRIRLTLVKLIVIILLARHFAESLLPLTLWATNWRNTDELGYKYKCDVIRCYVGVSITHRTSHSSKHGVCWV